VIDWRGTWAAGGALACTVAVWGCRHNPVPTDWQRPTALSTAGSAARASEPASNPRSAPSDAGPKGLFTFKVGAVQLELQGCVLTFSSQSSKGRFEVAFPGTCTFADNAKGAVQIVNTAQGQVVLVEVSRPVPPSYPGDRSCDTRIRGVLIRGDSVFVSKDIQKVASCASGPWDEVMFHAFALHVVPIESASTDGG
jgi:hypothetical protein